MADMMGLDIGTAVALIDVISKQNAALISALGIKSMATNVTGDGILITMTDDTQYDIPLSGLPYLKTSNISDAINSISTGTVASSKAVNDLRLAILTDISNVISSLGNYVLKANISDSIITDSSTNVASSKAIKTLNDTKINKTDIENVLSNNTTKIPSSKITYDLDQKFNDYIKKLSISQDKNATTIDTVPSSHVLNESIDDLENTYIAKTSITDNFNGTSKELVISQYGAKLIRDLISAAVTGMKYMSKIDNDGFNALDVWHSGEIYRASEEIVFKTVTIPNKAMIIMKTDYVEGTPLDITDFDYFSSTLDISHTAEEVDKSVSIVLDSGMNMLGWVDIDNCSMTCNETTRILSIFPTDSVKTSCYINGVKLEITDALTFEIPDMTGYYYIYLNESGVMSYTLSYDANAYDKMPIAFVRWNGDDHSLVTLVDMRIHNLLMNAPSRALTSKLGIQLEDGLAAFNIGSGATSDDSCCKLALINGSVRQAEKLIKYIHNDTPILPYQLQLYPYFYTRKYWIQDSPVNTYKGDPASTDVPLKMGTAYPMYSKNNNNVFTLEETSSDKYIAVYVGVGLEYRAGLSAISILGQGEYNTLDDCNQYDTISTLNWGDLNKQSIRLLYRLVYHVSDAYTNSYKSKIVQSDDLRDYVLIKSLSSGSVTSGMSALKVQEIGSSNEFTAVGNTVYYLKSGSKDAVITLPNTGISVQSKIVFQEVSGILSDSNTVTIDGTAATINGASEIFIINRQYVTCEFEWTGSTWLLKVNGTLIKPDYIEPVRLPASTLSLASGNLPIGATTTSPNIGDIFNDGVPKFQRDANFAVSILPDIGDIKMTARLTAPDGWLICDGSTISRTQYSALFGAIGTQFGSGDGSTTFNLPDFRSRMPLGAGQGVYNLSFNSADVNIGTNIITIPSNKVIYTGTPVKLVSQGVAPTGLVNGTTYYAIKLTDTTITLATSVINAVANTSIDITTQGSGINTLIITYSDRTVGEIGGQEQHNQTEGELVKHDHDYSNHYLTEYCSNAFNTDESCADEPMHTVSTSITGGSQPFNVMNPYVGVNFVIKY